MKNILMLIFLICGFSFVSKSQKANNEERTVTLTVIGEGKTVGEARTNALKSAMEQAFGAFLSSSTEVINDSLTKDEIVSISNGNVQEYKIIDEKSLNNGTYLSTLSVTVSVEKLASYMQKKGVATVDFKGTLFSYNINLRELNKKNELLAVRNLIKICNEILKNTFEFEMKVGEPKLNSNNGFLFDVDLFITAKANNNLDVFYDYIIKTLSSISMAKSEIDNYTKLNMPRYGLLFLINTKEASKLTYKNIGYRGHLYKMDYPGDNYVYIPIILRDPTSFEMIKKIESSMMFNLFNFQIKDGISSDVIADALINSKEAPNLPLILQKMISYRSIDFSKEFSSKGGYTFIPFVSIPYSLDNSNNNGGGNYISYVQPSFYEFEKDKSDQLQLLNKMLFDNQNFYTSVTDKIMIKGYWPGAGKYYYDNSTHNGQERMFRLPPKIDLILLSRVKANLEIMNLSLVRSYTKDALSHVTNFKIEMRNNN
jgi:hypothetical protein